jgi:hypothetical protein
MRLNAFSIENIADRGILELQLVDKLLVYDFMIIITLIDQFLAEDVQSKKFITAGHNWLIFSSGEY